MSKQQKVSLKKAIDTINQQGILITFPIDNKKEPDSLWAQFYPKKKMIWKWDETGDNKVGEMWMLMKKLSDCKEVVYSKWYRGRATFFSRELFTALLCDFKQQQEKRLSPSARLIFETLESDSPLSTKQLKRLTELTGKDNEAVYNRAMKELFAQFKIVAYGEVDDGAFPSLAVGATHLLFEELTLQADEMKPMQAKKIIDKYLPETSLFRKFYSQLKKSL